MQFRKLSGQSPTEKQRHGERASFGGGPAAVLCILIHCRICGPPAVPPAALTFLKCKCDRQTGSSCFLSPPIPSIWFLENLFTQLWLTFWLLHQLIYQAQTSVSGVCRIPATVLNPKNPGLPRLCRGAISWSQGVTSAGLHTAEMGPGKVRASGYLGPTARPRLGRVPNAAQHLLFRGSNKADAGMERVLKSAEVYPFEMFHIWGRKYILAISIKMSSYH